MKTLWVPLILLLGVTRVFSQPLFAPPVNLGATINTSGYESDPFWDGPRQRLYFVSDRDRGIPAIFFSDWTGTDWTIPVKLGPQISSGDEQSPSVSPDGQKLYFVASARQGYLWDIWVSTWNSSINDWETPQNLGPPVAAPDPGGEFSAHIAPDGRLFFSTIGDPDSLFPSGRCGLYASQWNGSSWSVPQLQWGCGQDPQYPSVSADGQWLYFSEFGQIYAVAWDGLGWGSPAYGLNQQFGGRTTTPSVTPSGETLFIAGTADLGGYGGRDIYMAKRLIPSKIYSIKSENLIFLIIALFLAGIYWIAHSNLKPAN
ncbi:MAG: hypothetical protein L0Z48_02135 [candidate division Zixibacteria bacterium]|nr:hypothetical protein [candidate division Zixibacteria bacterium]